MSLGIARSIQYMDVERPATRIVLGRHWQRMGRISKREGYTAGSGAPRGFEEETKPRAMLIRTRRCWCGRQAMPYRPSMNFVQLIQEVSKDANTKEHELSVEYSHHYLYDHGTRVEEPSTFKRVVN